MIDVDPRSGRYQDADLLAQEIKHSRDQAVSVWNVGPHPAALSRGLPNYTVQMSNTVRAITDHYLRRLRDPCDASETAHFYRTDFANLHKEFDLTLRQKYISYYRMGRKHPGEVGVMEILVGGSYCESAMPSLLAACLGSHEMSFFSE